MYSHIVVINNGNQQPGIMSIIVNHYHAEYCYVLHSSPIVIPLTNIIPIKSVYFQLEGENSVDPDQMASSEAI